MDRIALIKQAQKKLKKLKKRSHGVYIPVSKLSEEELAIRRSKNLEKGMRLYKKRRENGWCVRCSSEVVVLSYSHRGFPLITRNALYCPNHWESPTIRKEMQDALSSGRTIHTVCPMVTHGHKPDADNTSKHR